MAIDTVVLSEDVQADGTIWVVYQFTIQPEGVVIETPSRLLAAGTDALAFGQALAPSVEAEARRNEYDILFGRLTQGEFLVDAAPTVLITQAQFERYAIRRIVNWMNSGNLDAYNMSLMKPVIFDLQGTQVAAAIDSTNQVGNAIRGKLNSFAVAADQITHTEPELDPFG